MSTAQIWHKFLDAGGSCAQSWVVCIIAYISYQGYSRHTIRYKAIRNTHHLFFTVGWTYWNGLLLYKREDRVHHNRLTLHWTKRWTWRLHLFQTVSVKSHTQAESASSVICACVLLNFAGYTSRLSHTPSSLLPIAPLVHPDKSGLSIQHHVEVGLSCRKTLTLPVLRDLAGPVVPSHPSLALIQIHTLCVYYAHAVANLNWWYVKVACVYCCSIALWTCSTVLTLMLALRSVDLHARRVDLFATQVIVFCCVIFNDVLT